MTEAEIIARYFTDPAVTSDTRVTLGVGDDAAILKYSENCELAVSVDTLVFEVHFPKQTPPYDIGYKSLAVSLSDMAAMGACPRSALLSLTLPEIDESWLNQFSNGFFALAKRYGVSLIGGDICHGPMSVTTVVHGDVPSGQAIQRNGAKIGDLVFVTGELGDAGLALTLLSQQQIVPKSVLSRLNRPEPRVFAGIQLRKFASAAIDISDGLWTDLEKLLIASGCGAHVVAEKLPISATMRELCDDQQSLYYALGAGDDYEICFTVPKTNHDALKIHMEQLELPVFCIGEIIQGSEMKVLDKQHHEMHIRNKGYDHFRQT